MEASPLLSRMREREAKMNGIRSRLIFNLTLYVTAERVS